MTDHFSSHTHRQDVAQFVNAYPSLEVEHELVKGEHTSTSSIVLNVTLRKDDDDDDEDLNVVAPFFPTKKMANWWLLVGEPSTRQLHVIKKTTVPKTQNFKLEFTLPQGKHALKLYVVCDSYMGADHVIDLEALDVAEGEDSDEDSDEEMESGED